jgi:ribosomal protein L37AE/L43A
MERKKPEECAHRSVNRVMDRWRCNDCGAEFEPVDPKNRTPWSVEKRE